MANKHWIEVHHPGQFRPSLEDITDRRPEDLATIIRFFDDEGIPWAFGCGERMPDQIEWTGSGRDMVLWPDGDDKEGREK